MAHPNEHDLGCVLGIRGGRREALGDLYDRYSPLLLALTLRILKDPHEAEEAVQDTWTQVWTRAGSYDPRRGPVSAWILTIARTRALDRARRAETRRRLESQGEVGATDSPVDTSSRALRAELHEQVTRAFAELTASQRHVLEMAYFGGKTQREIAEELNTPLGTVKSWTRQGLLRLRAILPRGEIP